jgi:uncharacterized protein YneF (UPF0154 family)
MGEQACARIAADMRLLAIVAGAVIGFVAGYFIGVIAACDWLIPSSNLCGIYGVFLTGPVGLLIGSVGGWFWSRRREKSARGGLA